MALWTQLQASCDSCSHGVQVGQLCVQRNWDPAQSVASVSLSVSEEEPTRAEAAASLVQKFMNPRLCPMKQREMGDENQVKKLQVTITEL